MDNPELRIPNVWELQQLTVKHALGQDGSILIGLYIVDEGIAIYLTNSWDKLWGFVDACRILYGQYCGFEVKVTQE